MFPNIHPIFVHFPIGLLMMYSLIELIPLNHFLPWFHVNWVPIKRFLLYVGTLAAVPTIITGLIAKLSVGEYPLVIAHEIAAITTISLFTILSCLTLLLQFKKIKTTKTRTLAIKILSFVGLLGLVTVGALGGAIFHGTDADPVVSFITNILNLK